VILAKTVKGWTLGEGTQGKNVAHQQKKMSLKDLKTFRDEMQLPIADKDLEEAPFHLPDRNSPEMQYLMDRRHALGGGVPRRVVKAKKLPAPAPKLFERYLKGSGENDVSTTGTFSRLLADLLADPGATLWIRSGSARGDEVSPVRPSAAVPPPAPAPGSPALVEAVVAEVRAALGRNGAGVEAVFREAERGFQYLEVVGEDLERQFAAE